MVIYMESSALVKMAIREKETEALTRWLAEIGEPQRMTSDLAMVEVPRAVMRQQPTSLLRAREVVEQIHKMPLDAQLLAQAAALNPPLLRSLDAIHLAAALRVRERLSAVVSYDDRLLDAAKSHGLPVARPS